MCPSRSLIEQYVLDLVSSGAIASEAVKRAFFLVKRHRFLDHWYRLEADRLQATWSLIPFDRDHPDDESLREIYSDSSLVTRVNGLYPTSSTTSPQLMAGMLEALELLRGMTVLEIGTGTGYNAALMAEIVGDPAAICTIDLQGDVLEQARTSLRAEGYGDICMMEGDGFYGYPEGSPYDRIIATVGCSDISPHWVEQLSEDGLMLIPLQHGWTHPLVRVIKGDGAGGDTIGRVVGSSQFMMTDGMLAWANPWQSYLIGGLEDDPLWLRPPPDEFAVGTDSPEVFRDPAHRDFHFFLSLSSRELWRSNLGYGLADPGAGAAVVLSGDGVRGYARRGSGRSADRLYDRLLELVSRWDDLGRPAARDYDLFFSSKRVSPSFGGRGKREWVIERVCTWEVIRLP